METSSSYRDSNRARLRRALIRAARDLTVEHGWESVRMLDVAKAVGVSRQTVYNEFRGRAGLAEALTLSEVRQFAQRVRGALFEHGADVRAAGYAAILLTLDEAARNPLVQAVQAGGRGGTDELLPALTTRPEIVLAEAGGVLREWTAAFLPTLPADVVTTAVDAVIRLTVSHILLPRDTPAASATALAEVFVRLLKP
ncbi:TetR/AcrR family transcriptional regulator [Paractinoplanes ferrugineus]|uniref:TetR family transcriptional regulator n=1 Tax=Paractinoplanes ferrugineus TaxID=113564 RepID=A0A919MHI3_9ACTN|nr:TetR family transcriptional regulator [Actinoplanes ferrugineus]GIE15858.1 TetR family transcriptional regulator [Actinoplanes ferrugineus]